MPKFNLDNVKTDGTADQINKDLEARLEALIAADRALDNELTMRATNDGDLRMLVDLFEERVTSKEDRLKGGTELTLSSGTGAGLSPKGGTDANATATKLGLDLLADHAGMVSEAELSLDYLKRLRHSGVPFQQLSAALLDAIEKDPRSFVMGTTGLVPAQWVADQDYRDRLQTAFNALLMELSVPITGDPAHRVTEARDVIRKLRAIPATPVTTGADELYTLLTTKLSHDPKTESPKDYLARVELLLQSTGARTVLTEIGTHLGIDWKKDSTGKVNESPKDYRDRLMAAMKSTDGNIGDFLDKIGTNPSINLVRNTGETDQAYAERIFMGAADYTWTYNTIYTWLKDELRIPEDEIKKVGGSPLKLFVGYVKVHNESARVFNNLSGMKKMSHTLVEHPLPRTV